MRRTGRVMVVAFGAAVLAVPAGALASESAPSLAEGAQSFSTEPATSAPAVAEDVVENSEPGGTRLSRVFYRGARGEVLQRTLANSVWGRASTVGGKIVGAPAAAGIWWTASRPRMELAVRGTDNALWIKERAGFGTFGPGPWDRVGGKLTSSPAVTGGAGVVDYYVRGTDGALWTKRYSGATGWTGWISLGGRLLAGTGPAVSASGDYRSVWITGTDHKVWARVLHGTTPAGPWNRVSIISTSDTPAAAQVNSDTTIVFVRGSDNALRLLGRTEVSLGGRLTSGPGADSLMSRTGALLGVDVVARGTDNALWARSLRGSTWSPWKRW